MTRRQSIDVDAAFRRRLQALAPYRHWQRGGGCASAATAGEAAEQMQEVTGPLCRRGGRGIKSARECKSVVWCGGVSVATGSMTDS